MRSGEARAVRRGCVRAGCCCRLLLSSSTLSPHHQYCHSVEQVIDCLNWRVLLLSADKETEEKLHLLAEQPTSMEQKKGKKPVFMTTSLAEGGCGRSSCG